jgi:hypothetical protein
MYAAVVEVTGRGGVAVKGVSDARYVAYPFRHHVVYSDLLHRVGSLDCASFFASL